MTQSSHSHLQLSSYIDHHNDPALPPIEFTKSPKPSSSIFFTLSGLALIIGEAVNTVVWFPFSPFFTPSPAFSQLLFALGALSGLLAHLALLGVHMKQAHRARWLSLVSILFLCCGSVIYVIYVFLLINFNQIPGGLSFLYINYGQFDSVLGFLYPYLSQIFTALGNLFIVLNDGGLVLFGLALIRAAVFPRWTGLLFIASGTYLAFFGHTGASDTVLHYSLFGTASLALCIAYFRCAYILLQKRVRSRG